VAQLEAILGAFPPHAQSDRVRLFGQQAQTRGITIVRERLRQEVPKRRVFAENADPKARRMGAHDAVLSLLGLGRRTMTSRRQPPEYGDREASDEATPLSSLVARAGRRTHTVKPPVGGARPARRAPRSRDRSRRRSRRAGTRPRRARSMGGRAAPRR